MRTVVTCMLVVAGVLLMQGGAAAHETAEVPASYTLTVYYPDGTTKTLHEVESHQLLTEQGVGLLSVILKDGRRFLFSVQNRDFEFSHELSHIIAAAEAQKAAETGKR